MRGNPLITVMTARRSRPTRAVSVPKITALHVALVALKNWILPYGIFSTIVTENGPQFVSNVLAALCAAIGTKVVTTMETHPNAKGQREWFNDTLVACQRHYIDEQRTNWNANVQLLIGDDYTKVHRTNNTSPTSLILSRKPRGALVSEKTRTMDKYSTMSLNEAKQKALENLRLLEQQAEGASRKAVESYE